MRSANFEVSVKNGVPYVNGNLIVNRAKIQGLPFVLEDGTKLAMTFEYLAKSNIGPQIRAMLDGTAFVGQACRLDKDGDYRFSIKYNRSPRASRNDKFTSMSLFDTVKDATAISEDVAPKLFCSVFYDMPKELETDPIKRALMDYDVRPTRELIRNVSTFKCEQSVELDPRALPFGVRPLGFITDGSHIDTDTAASENMHMPITAKISGATFAIQYSTYVDAHNKLQRCIENVQLLNNSKAVRTTVFERALKQVMDAAVRPPIMITETDIQAPAIPEPGMATVLGEKLEALKV